VPSARGILIFHLGSTEKNADSEKTEKLDEGSCESHDRAKASRARRRARWERVENAEETSRSITDREGKAASTERLEKEGLVKKSQAVRKRNEPVDSLQMASLRRGASEERKERQP